MKTKFILFGLLMVLLNSTLARACGGTPELYSQWVLSTNAALSSSAISNLRGLGNEGLNALLKTHAALIARHADNDPQWQRLRAALDAVGGQRDCYASHLFWHTNFADAKAEAQRTGKPILSLRLLGNLNEELSCANSRFFRTTLYANKEVSDYLRDHFVLHWKSVRPVPRITIDMGDGRKIERTITGNSIHYVLDANGDVVDALPGLYGPRAFLTGLKEAEKIAARGLKLEPAVRATLLQNFHTAQLNNIHSAGQMTWCRRKRKHSRAQPQCRESTRCWRQPILPRRAPCPSPKPKPSLNGRCSVHSHRSAPNWNVR